MPSLNDLYVVGKEIGKGGFGKVYAGMRREDGLAVAIKFITKRRVVLWHTVNETKMPLELVLLERLQIIPSVIRLIEHFEFPDCYVLVMERLKGVDLFDYINEKTYLDEQEARQIFSQLLQAVIECHRNGVVHRDIKDENIIIERKTGKIKLIDFGSGAFLNANDDFFRDFEGTRVYAPPEWIGQRKYKAESSTVWQLGILLFDMIFGNIPFETDKEILNARLTWFRPVSANCRDLITRCLCIDASKRPTLADLAQHSWIASSMRRPMEMTDITVECVTMSSENEHDVAEFTEPTVLHTEAYVGHMKSQISNTSSLDYSSSSSSFSSTSTSTNSLDWSSNRRVETSDSAIDESSATWLPKLFSSTINCVQSKMQEIGIV